MAFGYAGQQAALVQIMFRDHPSKPRGRNALAGLPHRSPGARITQSLLMERAEHEAPD